VLAASCLLLLLFFLVLVGTQVIFLSGQGLKNLAFRSEQIKIKTKIIVKLLLLLLKLLLVKLLLVNLLSLKLL
jgi:hypothetical protein